jgi:hypothetical protein
MRYSCCHLPAAFEDQPRGRQARQLMGCLVSVFSENAASGERCRAGDRLEDSEMGGEGRRQDEGRSKTWVLGFVTDGFKEN